MVIFMSGFRQIPVTEPIDRKLGLSKANLGLVLFLIKASYNLFVYLFDIIMTLQHCWGSNGLCRKEQRMNKDFGESVRALANKARNLRDSLQTEEATKMSLIIPMFTAMGYDVFNPNEFCPEYTADVGVKKGEKVDYAIMQDGEPRILVECKSANESLDKYGSQLFRYFSVTSAKFGILTNGIVYRFYTDLDEENKMDLVSFLEVNLFDLRDGSIAEMKKFCKPNFDTEKIFSRAEELKYSGLIKSYLLQEIDEPSDDFVRLVLNDVYDGMKTQKVIERYKPLVKRTFSLLVDEMVRRRLTAALEAEEDAQGEAETKNIAEEPKSKIVTTEEELEAYYIVRGILAGHVPSSDVAYRDAESYFAILFKDNNRKPICRLNLDARQSHIMIPDEKKKFTRYDIDSLDDIYRYKDKLVAIATFWAK